jgi:hypothetical protein
MDAINNTVPNLNFTLGQEVENKTNFLDVTVTRNDNGLNFDIYRKPSFTDTIIPNDSCHPREHKLAAIRYLHNRMKTYNLNPTSTQMEYKLKQILHSNKYISILHNVNNTNNKDRKQNGPRSRVGKETGFITELFKDTDVKIAFTTNNTIETLIYTL